MVKVVWQAVSLLRNSAFFEIWLPNPELVIILTPSIKYSKDKGPDWYDFENFFSNPFDSTSILSNYVIGISNWGKDFTCFTTAIGISIFDPFSQKFRNYPISLENKSVGKINSSVKISKDSIIVASSNGIYGVKLLKNSFEINKLK